MRIDIKRLQAQRLAEMQNAIRAERPAVSIAHEFGVTLQAVNAQKRKLGLGVGKGWKKALVDQGALLAALLEPGATCEDVAVQFSCSRAYVSYVVHAHGYTMKRLKRMQQ